MLVDEPKKWVGREEEEKEKEKRKGMGGEGGKKQEGGAGGAGRIPGQAFRSSTQWQTYCPLTDSHETTLKAEAK